MESFRIATLTQPFRRHRLSRRAALASAGASLSTTLLGRVGLSPRNAVAQDATPAAATATGDNLPPNVPAWMRTPGAPSSPYGERAPAEESVVRLAPNPVVSFSPLADLHGTLTPNALFYEIHFGGIPAIDPSEHRLARPWPGRAADALHHGRPEALPLCLGHPLPGVRGEFLLGVDGGLDEPHGAALPRLDQQRRMDRGAARHHPARGRDQAGWGLDAGGGGGCRGAQPQHPHRQGDGRWAARLRRQRRGLAALPGLSRCACCSPASRGT